MTFAILEAAILHEWEKHEAGQGIPDVKWAQLAIAAVTPLLRATALEEAAKVAEECPEYPGEVGTGDRIAAAIRALKEQP